MLHSRVISEKENIITKGIITKQGTSEITTLIKRIATVTHMDPKGTIQRGTVIKDSRMSTANTNTENITICMVMATTIITTVYTITSLTSSMTTMELTSMVELTGLEKYCFINVLLLTMEEQSFSSLELKYYNILHFAE